MIYPNLYSLWNAARVSGVLPPEWARADTFIAWCAENGYRAEFGLDAEFTAENLLAAIPTADKTEADELCKRFTVDELLKMAKLAGINLGRAKKESAIAAKLVEADITVEAAEQLLKHIEGQEPGDAEPEPEAPDETEDFTDEPS
jgi:hypothetical protein